MNNSKKRSISKDLTISLVAAITVVSCVVFYLNYRQTAQRERVWLEAKADEYIEMISASLEIPLWDMDREIVKYICTSYLNNYLINKVQLYGNAGEEFFLKEKNRDIDQDSGLFRTNDIYHNGELIGRVEIQLTRGRYGGADRQNLFSSMSVILGPALALILLTGLMFRTFLKKPLENLTDIAQSYAAGDFRPGADLSSYREFAPFVSVLEEMGEQIDTQMKELRRAEEKYRNIFENALEGIFQSTPDGEFIDVNPTMARICGYDSPADLIDRVKDIGRQLYVYNGQRDEFIDILREHGSVTGFEAEIYRSDGSIAVVSLNAHTILNSNGEILYIEGATEDITHRKRNEEELNRNRERLEELVAERTRNLRFKNDELKREILERKKAEEDKERLEAQLRHSHKMEAIGALASGIAHDFNNILQAVGGYVQLISSMKNLDERAGNYVREIDVMVHRAADLVKQLLTFSRKVEPNLGPINLKHAVRQAVAMLERTIPKMIAIETRFAPEDAVIDADPTQVNQMLMNLGANARDAMPDGGKLLFEISRESLDQNDVLDKAGLAPGDYILLRISDTGQGIDMKDQRHIFDPFYTTKEIGKGTGLGLSMVYGIVQSHGGIIQCTSQPCQGASFEIYFPALEADVTAVRQDVTPEEPVQGNGEKLLLADDEEAILDVAREMLEDNGYKVLTATSGEECLEIYHRDRNDIDLVILDLGMPGIGGRGALIEILRTVPEQKVIIASGYGAGDQAQAALASGAREFIAKPYRFVNMLNIVSKVLEAPE